MIALRTRPVTPSPAGPRIALLALALALSGCLSLNYERHNVNAQVSDRTLARLGPSGANLETCLDVLGAPNLVWQTFEGAALAWVQSDVRNFSFTVSVPVDQFSAAVTYGTIADDADTIALFFNDAWELVVLRRGRFRDLAPLGPLRVAAPLPPR